MQNPWPKPERKLLLDTHAFIWCDSEPARIPEKVVSLFEDKSIPIFLSTASLWEIQIKLRLGKLRLNLSLEEIIENQKRNNDLQILPVTLEHVLALSDLPDHHKDPFDRLLIAQAKTEKASLVSQDPIFAKYEVDVIW